MTRFPKSFQLAFSRSLVRASLLALFAAVSCSVVATSDFSFRTDILPVLTKAGCNAGACHGTSTGQGGFRLSLLGFAPEEDFWTITREFEGRRLTVDAPEESLFLRKPTEEVDHEGGRRIKKGSAEYQALLEWITKGAPYGSADLVVTNLTVTPEAELLSDVSGKVHLSVTAALSNGRSRDVSSLALYTSNDEGIAEVDRNGVVTMRSRGLTSIMVRFGGQVTVARVGVPLATTAAKTDRFLSQNFIDEEILAEFKRMHITPAALSSDAEFVRRVHLDLTGRLPSVETALRFSTKTNKADRSEIVHHLLKSDEFVDFWTLKFGDLLRIGGKKGPEEATRVYHNWVREQLSINQKWDEVSRQLLTGQGDITKYGPANFYTMATDPRDMAEFVGNVFLGVQLGCARCHAHPSDRWTQNDYYEFSAFFTRVVRNGNLIDVKNAGEIDYPKRKQSALPKALGGVVNNEAAAMRDRREALAQAVTRDPLFARSMVNRIWKQLFGRGLIEPVDDLRPTNPAIHPVLLERLSDEFVRRDFNLRWLIGTIASSRTYQLSSRGDSSDLLSERFFARSSWRMLPGQALLDAISQVTEVPEKFEGEDSERRAVQLIGVQTPSYALDVLGRCKREGSCESAGFGGGLAQALHLINGSTVHQKLKGGILEKRLREGKSVREVVQEFYLRALARLPDQEEESLWIQTLEGVENRNEVLEDFLWTLLNCREFAYNH